MKLQRTNERRERANTVDRLRHACGESCRKTRVAILTEAAETSKTPERLLRLALNEAEALAWQTPYPQLVFPALAGEKLQEVTAWNRRQHDLLRRKQSLN